MIGTNVPRRSTLDCLILASNQVMSYGCKSPSTDRTRASSVEMFISLFAHLFLAAAQSAGGTDYRVVAAVIVCPSFKIWFICR